MFFWIAQEESSDESTIISSQTSTLTRNLGPEALRLNLHLTSEDIEHVIDSDDDDEEEEEEEELEVGQEEVMEEALENAVSWCSGLLKTVWHLFLKGISHFLPGSFGLPQLFVISWNACILFLLSFAVPLLNFALKLWITCIFFLHEILLYLMFLGSVAYISCGFDTSFIACILWCQVVGI